MSEVIDILWWKWNKPGYRSSYDGNTVNTAMNMIDRHLSLPHRFTCVTDDPSGISERVRVVDIRSLPSYAWMNVPNPSNARNPSCYVRLFLFSAAAKELFGDRVLSVDLDLVVTGDMSPIVSRAEDFVMWGGQALGPGKLGAYNWVNGSVQLLRTGTRQKVFDTFNPRVSPLKAHMSGCRGSDQGWIAHCLGKEAITTFGMEEGIHSFRNHIVPNKGRLFENTKIVAFHGKHDPWHREVQVAYPWVKEHYR